MPNPQPLDCKSNALTITPRDLFGNKGATAVTVHSTLFRQNSGYFLRNKPINSCTCGSDGAKEDDAGLPNGQSPPLSRILDTCLTPAYCKRTYFTSATRGKAPPAGKYISLRAQIKLAPALTCGLSCTHSPRSFVALSSPDEDSVPLYPS